MCKCAVLEGVNTHDWYVEVHGCVYVNVQIEKWRYVYTGRRAEEMRKSGALTDEIEAQETAAACDYKSTQRCREAVRRG